MDGKEQTGRLQENGAYHPDRIGQGQGGRHCRGHRGARAPTACRDPDRDRLRACRRRHPSGGHHLDLRDEGPPTLQSADLPHGGSGDGRAICRVRSGLADARRGLLAGAAHAGAPAQGEYRHSSAGDRGARHGRHPRARRVYGRAHPQPRPTSRGAECQFIRADQPDHGAACRGRSRCQDRSDHRWRPLPGRRGIDHREGRGRDHSSAAPGWRRGGRHRSGDGPDDHAVRKRRGPRPSRRRACLPRIMLPTRRCG